MNYMNYMGQIAKMLDVEIGEAFKIEGKTEELKLDDGNGLFRFSDFFLEYYSDVYEAWRVVGTYALQLLLNGMCTIRKIPKKKKLKDFGEKDFNKFCENYACPDCPLKVDKLGNNCVNYHEFKWVKDNLDKEFEIPQEAN